MKKIEPTGVFFAAACDIETEKCRARPFGPVTAVWSPPGRTQVNVCGACLEEMVRQGEWEIQRGSRRADFAIYDRTGKLQLVVELKSTRSGEHSPERAVEIRKNLRAHSGIPRSPYFLIAFPDHLYLWKPSPADSDDRLPDYHVDSDDILKLYGNGEVLSLENLSEREIAELLSHWINDVIHAEDQTDLPDWVLSSGLYQAIKDGAAVQQAAV